MKTTRHLLPFLLALLSALPVMSAVEKEYTFDFSTSAYGLPTEWLPDKGISYPIEYPQENGITIGIVNHGIRVSRNAGYEALQISAIKKKGDTFGCFFLSVPDGKKIVFVDFIGLNGANSIDCKPYMAGPFDSDIESSATSMGDAWSDEEGKPKLYFRHIFTTDQTPSAFIKQIIVRVLEEETTENPENPGDNPENPGDNPDNPGDNPDNPGDNPDNPGENPDNPGDNPDNPGENPDNPGENPDNPGENPDNPEKPAVALTEPTVGILGANGRPSFPMSLTLAEADTITVALYSKPEQATTLVKQEQVAEPKIEILDADNDPVAGKFEITPDGLAEFTVIPKEAGTYTLRLTWEDSADYKSGTAQLPLSVYLPIIAETDVNKTLDITISGNGALADRPTYSEYDTFPLLTPPAGYEGEGMYITLTPARAADTKFYYVINEIKDLDDLAAAKEVAASTKEAQQSAADRKAPVAYATETNPATGLPVNFQHYADGERLTLHGKTGYFMLASRKNGVTSPVRFYYYAITPASMSDIPVGVSEIYPEPETDTEATYYTLDGLPAAPDVRGLLIRRTDRNTRLILR